MMKLIALSFMMALLVGLLSAAPQDISAQQVTEATCRSDYDALVTAIAQNREQSLNDIQTEIDTVFDLNHREKLKVELERVWDDEESQRNQASFILIDCLRSAEAK